MVIVIVNVIVDLFANHRDVIEVLLVGEAADGEEVDDTFLTGHLLADFLLGNLVGTTADECWGEDVLNLHNLIFQGGEHLEEGAGDVGRDAHDVVVATPCGQLQRGIDVDMGVVGVYPADLLLGAYLVEHDVMGHQEADGHVVLHGGVDAGQERFYAGEYVMEDSPIVNGVLAPFVKLMAQFGHEAACHDAEVSVLQGFFHRPLDMGIGGYLRQQVHLLGDVLHELAAVTVDEEVYVVLRVVDGLEQSDETYLGAADLKVVYGNENVHLVN